MAHGSGHQPHRRIPLYPRRLPLRRGSTIVNNVSIAATTVFPGMSAYSASKAALLSFTNTLREELRSRGIRVIAFTPGATNTDIWKQF